MGKKRKTRDRDPARQKRRRSRVEEMEAAAQSSSRRDPSDADSDSLGEDEDSPSEDLVEVGFEFFDPKPGDFHGTKALLNKYLDDEEWDVNGLVDLFLAQTTVGTVVKTSEEESPIGIITALNLARYRKSPCMKKIREYLERQGGDRPEMGLFWTSKAKNVGLLVSERLINLPTELVPPLYEGLFEEIAWATEDEPSQQLRDSFKFEHYLLLTKVFEERPKKSKTGGSSEKEVGRRGSFVFVKPEDEIFLKLSSWSFTFPAKSEAAASRETKNLKQLRLVMGLDAKRVPELTTLLKGLTD